MRNISRIDSDRVKGWYVRLNWNQKSHQRFFSDGKYKSKDWALIKAILHLDKLIEILSNSKPKVKTRFKVNRSTMKEKKYGKTYFWNVYLVRYKRDDGSWTHKSWSTQKFGEQEAFRQAKQFSNKLNN